MRRTLFLVSAIATALLVVWVGTTWSLAVLESRSMEPWASPGALLVQRAVPRDEVRPDDVVTVTTAAGGLVTHRVVEVTGDTAILKGDRSRLPDPVPVLLEGRVDRVVVAVPRVGGLLTEGAPLLWGGLALLALGVAAVRMGGTAAPAGAAPSTDVPPDPRIEALLATLEQLEEDGIDRVVLRDVVRVRTGAVAGVPEAERSGAVLSIEDGGRFYVLAVTDVDTDMLALVPTDSERRRSASAAIDAWWEAVVERVPAGIVAAIEPWSR